MVLNLVVKRNRNLLDRVTLHQGMARIASQAYRVIIVDRDPDTRAAAFLADFRASGGTVIDCRDYDSEADYLSAVRNASQTVLCIEGSEHLRLSHVRKYGVDVVFLSNEGEAPLSATVRERVAEIWDCEQGTRTPHNADTLTLSLAPRKSVHLILG